MGLLGERLGQEGIWAAQKGPSPAGAGGSAEERDSLSVLRDWAASRGLPWEACERLSSAARVKRYWRGETLYSRSDVPDAVYFLCAGRIGLDCRKPGGRSRVLQVVTGPELLGEDALIARRPHRLSARAMDDSLVCVIAANRFADLWESEQGFPGMLVRNLARKTLSWQSE